MQAETAYPPLGTLKPVAEDVWIVDDAPLHFAGLPLPIRMTVVRMPNGELLLHSPTRFSPGLAAELDELGPVRHLLAPSVAHWMFLRDWQAAYPSAVTWAVPGLRDRAQVREAGVRIDAEVGAEAPAEWQGAIDLVMIRSTGFVEVDLFHKPSRTLLVTDLVLNLEPERLPPVARMLGRTLGVCAPHGRAPLYLRLLLSLNRRRVAAAANRLVALRPERVIISHGRWFDRDATSRLRASLDWLLGPPPVEAGSRVPARGRAATTVVITGASSGIGRAAALAFARRGANVVLAARRADVLGDVVAECEALGAAALAVPTDVTDAEAVTRLADEAERTFGRIDVWINNAGTGVFGPYQDADIALHRRTVEVNLFGTMHGAWAALPIFLRQGRGILINNISLGGWAPTPFAAAYTASKFGLRGLTASLRQELVGQPNIHVCGVFPAMVDTPGFVHGANMSGRQLDPGPLLYRPEDVAETFVQLSTHPRDEVAVGWPARAGQAAYALAPRPTEYAIGVAMRRLLARADHAPRTEGAVRKPIPAGTATSGGWLDRKGLPGATTISTGLAIAGVASLAALGLALARRRGSRPRDRVFTDEDLRRLV